MLDSSELCVCRNVDILEFYCHCGGCYCSRPEPVAGGSSRSGGGKLGLLINKLHTFLAVSAEQGGEHGLPGHWSGESFMPLTSTSIVS